MIYTKSMWAVVPVASRLLYQDPKSIRSIDLSPRWKSSLLSANANSFAWYRGSLHKAGATVLQPGVLNSRLSILHRFLLGGIPLYKVPVSVSVFACFQLPAIFLVAFSMCVISILIPDGEYPTCCFYLSLSVIDSVSLSRLSRCKQWDNQGPLSSSHLALRWDWDQSQELHFTHIVWDRDYVLRMRSLCETMPRCSKLT